jgi:uncharacterized Zn finger protein (UPF0148 family)
LRDPFDWEAACPKCGLVLRNGFCPNCEPRRDLYRST